MGLGLAHAARAQTPHFGPTASDGTVSQPLSRTALRSRDASTDGADGHASSHATTTSVFSCADVTEIPTVECEALVALYNGTNGAGWTDNSGWLTTNTPCSWYGVTCSAGAVLTIDLSSNQLTGAIPPEIGNLSNLTSLWLYSNQLTGTVPLEVAQVGANASYCDLTSNDASLCMPNTPDYQALGDPICGLPLSDTCTPLPVELASFEALRDGPNVLLKWATASETNNAGFEVQHQSDEGFRALAFIEGAGTTTKPQSYAYRVEDLAPGPHTFRLKQLDFDGSFEYSPEVEVTVGLPGKYLLSEAYPNPFNPRTRFTLAVARPQQVRIEVYNALGQQVATLHDGVLEANKTHAFVFDAGALASGVYVLRISGETFAATRTLTLLK